MEEIEDIPFEEQRNEEELPTTSEAVCFTLNLIFETAGSVERKHLWEIWQRLDAGDDSADRDLEKVIKRTIELYRIEVKLDDFNIIPAENPDLANLKNRIMLRAVHRYLAWADDPPERERMRNEEAEWLLQTMKMMGQDFDAGFETLEAQLVSSEDSLVSIYYPEFFTADRARPFPQGPSRTGRKISCPICHWAPPIGEFWQCEECLTEFDTFETGAKCPGCENEWEKTTCLACTRESVHGLWYSK